MALQHQPIRTSETNAFAHATVKERLARNIHNVLLLNPDYPPAIAESLRRLGDTISSNGEIAPLDLPAWDADQWRAEHAYHGGTHWHDAVWFFAETYAFRLILQAVRYFETLRDPYAPLKIRELESGAPFLPIERYQRGGTREAGPALVERALHICMWGNKADISFALGGELDHQEGDPAMLFINHTEEAVGHLTAAGAPVHIVMDNSGAELAGDLVLAMALRQVTGTPVVLHLKFYPIYVSDTIVRDVYTFLDYGMNHHEPLVRDFCGDALRAIQEGEILLAPDPYWCETQFLCDAPPRIRSALQGAAAVVVKGDFNYRRVMRDTIWPAGTVCPEAMGATGLPPLILLRTMKSDCLAGASEPTCRWLDDEEPGWRTAGRRGLIQVV